MIEKILALLTCLVALIGPSTLAATWQDSFYPYRVSLKLDAPTSGEVRLNIPTRQIIDMLQPLALDQLDEKTLAYDRAIVVDPASGKIVGGFKLVPTGPEVDVEGDFAAVAKGQPSKWAASMGDAKVSYEDSRDGETTFRAIHVENKNLEARTLAQTVKLNVGAFYLLDYRVRAMLDQGWANIILTNPAKRHFAEVPGSYFLKLTPDDHWIHQKVLYCPEVAESQVRLECGINGTVRFGAIHLRPVEWALVANLPALTERLDVYLIAHGGHFHTQPDDALIANAKPQKSVPVKASAAELADLNPRGVMVDLGEGTKVWTIPTYLPLRVEKIALTQPRKTSDAGEVPPIQATVMRGQSTSVLLAIQSVGTSVAIGEPTSTLPVSVKFERIAALDLFDSFYPQGKRVEARYDPIVGLGFPFTPPDRNGVHLLLCTITAPADGKPGISNGTISMTIRTQVPFEKALKLPVELRVLPGEIKPTWHFGTLFNAEHLTAFYPKTPKIFHSDSTTIARFHGYKQESLRDTSISRLSRPDTREPEKAALLPLAWKYFHTMLDDDLVPHGLTLFSLYDYKIEDQGAGKAPKLSNWTFTEYDKAIDEFLVKRNAPYNVVWHTNGHIMDIFPVADGAVYSTREKPADEKEPWHVLSNDEYIKLLADYFDAVSEHLDKKGLADRSIIVIDESDETTYQRMYDVHAALAARPFGKKIRWIHTTYKTSIYTQKLPSGKLLMDEMLDIPTPDGDEHFNFAEAAWYKRLQRPGKEPWVYYVETDHFNLDSAGLNTVITPLNLRNIGARGWYCAEAFIWSLPYFNEDLMGPRYPNGQTVNPWLNPYNNHGHGTVSFFYPPDPRGPAEEPTDRIIPSYRLHLMRDGIQDYALMDVLAAGKDDAGKSLDVNTAKLTEAEAQFKKLWTNSHVQWYISPETYRRAQALLHEAAE